MGRFMHNRRDSKTMPDQVKAAAHRGSGAAEDGHIVVVVAAGPSAGHRLPLAVENVELRPQALHSGGRAALRRGQWVAAQRTAEQRERVSFNPARWQYPQLAAKQQHPSQLPCMPPHRTSQMGPVPPAKLVESAPTAEMLSCLQRQWAYCSVGGQEPRSGMKVRHACERGRPGAMLIVVSRMVCWSTTRQPLQHSQQSACPPCRFTLTCRQRLRLCW